MCDDDRTLKALQALLLPMQSLTKQYADLVRDVDDMRAMMTEQGEDLRAIWFMAQMLWQHPAPRLIRTGLNPQTFTPERIPPVRKPAPRGGVEVPQLEE